ncbi:hypothetical protein CPB86DRAFT_786220 [Serendipita vermifera]|nr:hypothetical protein CPB86DRAFT_786220 [Serendipita vermifera]
MSRPTRHQSSSSISLVPVPSPPATWTLWGTLKGATLPGDQCLEFTVSPNSNVLNLKKDYQRTDICLSKYGPTQLSLWKLHKSIPLEDVDNVLPDWFPRLEEYAERVNNYKEMKEIFNVTPTNKELHFIIEISRPIIDSVKASNISSQGGGTKRRASIQLDGSEHRKQMLKNNREQALGDGIAALAPSSAASPHNIPREQESHPVANGRPIDTTGPPIDIYHPVFSEFRNKLSDRDIQIPAEYLLTVYQLMTASSAFYPLAKDRETAVRPLLSTLLELIVQITLANKTTNDGSIITSLKNAVALRLVLELKNEMSTGKLDVYFQGCYSYRKFWVDEIGRHFRDRSCCPTFILLILGPLLFILGAVFVDQVVVEPLMEPMWLGGTADVTSRAHTIARALYSLNASLETLDRYYRARYGEQVEATTYMCPHITHYDAEGELVPFKYDGRLLAKGSKAVFSAQTNSGRYLVIKFASKYNASAHALLARHGFAPKLHYARPCPQVPGFLMVVMDMISGTSAAEKGILKLPKSTYEIVEKAIKLLHDSGLVFGDLRPVNILLENKGDRPYLVDFDWCGRDEVDLYPITLNDGKGMNWPDGVGRGKVMKKNHDLVMLSRLREVKSTTSTHNPPGNQQGAKDLKRRGSPPDEEQEKRAKRIKRSKRLAQ